jgi:eukaryotic-like serine/threonine-protein kinase
MTSCLLSQAGADQRGIPMSEWTVPGYTELKELGSGGFGRVVLARHHAAGVLVAIKYLRADLLGDAMFAEMFRSEATALASIEDPNVVRLYEYVESPSGAAIVMELVEGVSLREILSHQGATTPEAALVVLQGSLLGLAAAHQRGVVHRDYKPENVLVDGGGASKLTDFGLAARTGDQPIPAGTLRYVAPEQIAGAPASPASDVYAATATFYECLTGRPPFSGEPEDLLRQHSTARVPLEPVPEPMRPLVALGLAKDPKYRPADAASLVTELKAIASRACGPDWERRGRSHLGEAALLLAALWPAGAPAAQQGTTVDRVQLHQQRPRLRLHPRRLLHLRPMPAAITIAAGIAVVAAGTALAAPVSQNQGTHGTGTPPPVTVQPVTLGPAPSGSPTPSASVPGVPTPSIQTSVSSAFAPQTGDVFVKYQDGVDANAKISGQVTNVTSGEVAELFAQQFPFTSAPSQVGSVALNPSGTTAPYSFQVTPTLATRYTVEVFQSSTATTPLATSAADTIYVIMGQPTSTTTHSCAGSQCTAMESITVQVPASALSAQMAAQTYTYFAVAYSPAAEPATPQTLQLGAGDPVVSTPKQISADEYQFSLTFSFSSNGEDWHAGWRRCTKSLEAQDGIGLPGAGSNGCGAQTMQYSATYIG